LFVYYYVYSQHPHLFAPTGLHNIGIKIPYLYMFLRR